MAPPADIMRERQMRHGKHEARTGTSNTATATRLQNRSYLTWLLSKIGAIAVKFGGVYAALCLMGMGDRTYTGEINIVFAALLLCGVAQNAHPRRTTHATDICATRLPPARGPGRDPSAGATMVHTPSSHARAGCPPARATLIIAVIAG